MKYKNFIIFLSFSQLANFKCVGTLFLILCLSESSYKMLCVLLTLSHLSSSDHILKKYGFWIPLRIDPRFSSAKLLLFFYSQTDMKKDEFSWLESCFTYSPSVARLNNLTTVVVHLSVFVISILLLEINCTIKLL